MANLIVFFFKKNHKNVIFDSDNRCQFEVMLPDDNHVQLSFNVPSSFLLKQFSVCCVFFFFKYSNIGSRFSCLFF